MQFLDFFISQTQYVDKFLSHTNQNSISLILSLLLKFDLDDPSDQNILVIKFILYNQQFRENLVSQILTILKQTTDESSIDNLIQTLSVLGDIDENYYGSKILEFLVNDTLFINLVQCHTLRYGELFIKILDALFPYQKPTTLKSFNIKLAQVNSVTFQKTLLQVIQHTIPQYVSHQVEKINVKHLKFFMMMQKFSYAKTPICRCFFGNSLLWMDLILCMKNYPKQNMMHSELVKIFRNGIRYSIEDNVDVCNLDELIITLLEIFKADRQQTKFYFGFVMQMSFQLKKYIVQLQYQNHGSWKQFFHNYIQKEIDLGNTPLDDTRVIDPNSPLNVKRLSLEKIGNDTIDDEQPAKLKLIQLQ